MTTETPYKNMLIKCLLRVIQSSVYIVAMEMIKHASMCININLWNEWSIIRIEKSTALLYPFFELRQKKNSSSVLRQHSCSSYLFSVDLNSLLGNISLRWTTPSSYISPILTVDWHSFWNLLSSNLTLSPSPKRDLACFFQRWKPDVALVFISLHHF